MSDVILERYPYRYLVMKNKLDNGMPDCRLQKHKDYVGWTEIYRFDNQMQMDLAIEDQEYTKWLAGDPAYVRDVVRSPY